MTMWRDAVDMKIPVHDNFKIHFIEKRAALLENFTKNRYIVVDRLTGLQSRRSRSG